MYGALALALAGLPAALATNFSVNVGANNQLVFDPETLTGVQANDWVIFTFVSKNHTVTQASFDAPCAPLAGGINSGFHPVSDPSNPPTFEFHVTDVSKPIWINCQQTGHCPQGMVFAINAPPDPASNSFSQFKQKAMGTSSSGGGSGGSGGGGSNSSQCPPTDNAGSPLTNTGTDGSFIVCQYQTAGQCEYFSDGSFSSGGSTCPNKINPPATATSPPGGDSYQTPPPQSWTMATTVVTSGTSSWTTTWTSYAGTPPPTFAPTPQDHKVIVGSDDGTQLVFNPNDIQAAIGDTVTFEFHAKNHSVVQSTFSAPCVAKDGGFKTDFMPTAVNQTTGLKTFQIKINDTAPIWGYCAQTNVKDHCGAGMVFGINAVDNGPNNFTAFQNLAEHINGTGSSPPSTTTSGSPGATQSKPSSAVGVHARGVVVALSLLGAVALLL